ncbi:MAG: DNA polymerase III subunit epsilon [Bacteroidota bacterium]|nr:MAG: DNA polymerase III epsilon subunit-like 3'-5' exonuclease [Bacteroidetes bacterium OLB12]GIL21592.1 MAG: DNA polymerase III subunit epsilon [Bacteroidota bacterium]
MKLNLKKPLCVFDLETTGISISQDRIIEIAVIKVMPSGEVIEKSNRVNPTIPIPPESTAIHGISNEDVKDKPVFKDLAKDYAKFFEGADLGGFNILKFDVPMLVEEFLRAGVEFDYSKKRIIDAQKIYHLMEKRNLAAALKFYCNKDLTQAHSAAADTQATLDVLLAQVERYENQPVTDNMGKPMGTIQNDMDVLHQLTATDMVDLAGRMIRNDKGEVIFNFGKHKGKVVTQVLKDEPSFYDWMMNSDFALDTKRRLTEIKLSLLKR